MVSIGLASYPLISSYLATNPTFEEIPLTVHNGDESWLKSVFFNLFARCQSIQSTKELKQKSYIISRVFDGLSLGYHLQLAIPAFIALKQGPWNWDKLSHVAILHVTASVIYNIFKNSLPIAKQSTSNLMSGLPLDSTQSTREERS
jgi:hypothetical protein